MCIESNLSLLFIMRQFIFIYIYINVPNIYFYAYNNENTVHWSAINLNRKAFIIPDNEVNLSCSRNLFRARISNLVKSCLLIFFFFLYTARNNEREELRSYILRGIMKQKYSDLFCQIC